MKSDISLAYRSLSRPDPLWPEQAIYGGYKYIQLNEGIWIHRTHEAYVNILMSNETTDAMRDFAKAEISNSGTILTPSQLQQNNALKFIMILKKQRIFAVQGYSLAAENFLSTINYTKIYTDAEYNLPKVQKISTEQLCILSSHMIVLINSSSTKLKSRIVNWGKVLTYNAESFSMPTEGYYLTGG